jgi:uncharacterized protein (TIGR03086 family)
VSLNEHATVETYTEVLAILREQIAATDSDDFTRPTPCSEWDVGGLVAHSIGAMHYYARLAGGDERVRPVVIEIATVDDMLPRFDAAAAAGVAAWSEPGVLDRQVRMVLGRMRGRDALAVHIGDLAVHAWDLGEARGVAVELPAPLAAAVLTTWEDVFVRLDRGTAFSREVTAPDGASPTARLVAYCGRTP